MARGTWDRARLCRQGIPRPHCGQPPPRLHLRPEARRLRRHQARTAAPIRHRGCDRTHENRRPPRPLLPQGPCRRAANAVLTAVGYNLGLILAWLRVLLRLILTALTQAFTTRSV